MSKEVGAGGRFHIFLDSVSMEKREIEAVDWIVIIKKRQRGFRKHFR